MPYLYFGSIDARYSTKARVGRPRRDRRRNRASRASRRRNR